jgi:hypothetical protein
MAISTASAKAKGAKLQKHVRDAILKAFPTLEPDDVRSCPMGSHGADIIMSPAAQRAFPYRLECKARKGVSLIYDALEQASHHKGAGEPVAIVKADRRRPLAVMDLDLFLSLTRPVME